MATPLPSFSAVGRAISVCITAFTLAACVAATPANDHGTGTSRPVSTASAKAKSAPLDDAAAAALSAGSRVDSPEQTQAILSEDYKIGSQDLLEVQIYGVENLKREVRVNSRGVISLPLIGAIRIGGLTAQEAEAHVTALYEKDYLRNPQVSIFIKEFTSQRITIEGAVNKPGVYPIKGQTSLLQAIAIAGGQGQLSDVSQVMLFRTERGERRTTKYDVEKIRLGEVEDPILINDDVVVVNRSPSRAALKDSLFRDVIDLLNPFSYIRPY